jgi:hypothetical protein
MHIYAELPSIVYDENLLNICQLDLFVVMDRWMAGIFVMGLCRNLNSYER